MKEIEFEGEIQPLKWSQPGKLGMWVAEMDYGIAPPIRAALQNALNHSLTGYPWPGLEEAMLDSARDWQRCTYGWEILPSDMAPARNVLSVLQALLSVLPENSPVAVPTPAYMPFLSIPPAQHHPVIEVGAQRDEAGNFQLPLSGLHQAFSQGAKLLILCNPWNPVGQSIPTDTLTELDALLADFPDVLVFADEIHSPLVLRGEFLSYARLSPRAAARTVTAVAASKGWNIAGLHCAQYIITNPELQSRLQPALDLLAFGPSPWGMLATQAAYSESRDWLEDVKSQIRANISQVQDWLLQTPKAVKAENLRVQLPHATYLSWWETNGSLGQNPAQTLLDAGVVVNPGSDFGKGWEQSFRLNLSCNHEVMGKALDIIAAQLV